MTFMHLQSLGGEKVGPSLKVRLNRYRELVFLTHAGILRTGNGTARLGRRV
jgi:hypothetical protein